MTQTIDLRKLGVAVLELGGGRRREDDSVDHAVGITEVAALAEAVGPENRPLVVIHARTNTEAEIAAKRILGAVAIGTEIPATPPLLKRTPDVPSNL